MGGKEVDDRRLKKRGGKERVSERIGGGGGLKSYYEPLGSAGKGNNGARMGRYKVILVF